MTNIVTINGALDPLTPAPNDALVKGLRDLLAMAESGRLQSFIGTGFCDDGNSRLAHWTDSHDDVYQMLGAIEWLKAEYIQRHT